MLRGSASGSDLQVVVDALAREWAYDRADTRTFSQFLHSKSLVQEKFAQLSDEQARALRLEFATRQEEKLRSTEELAGAIARGPQCEKFYDSLAALSSDLKRVCFAAGLRAVPGRERLIILCLLSAQSSDFALSCLDQMPVQPSFSLFRRYLTGWRYAIRLRVQGHEDDLRDNCVDTVEKVVWISSASVYRQEQYIAGLEEEERTRLATISEHLATSLPQKGFAVALGPMFAIFACLAHTLPDRAEAARRIVERLQTPAAAEIIVRMGAVHVKAALESAVVSPANGEYVSALIDGLRTNFSESIARYPAIRDLAKSGVAPVALSSRAALLHLGLQPQDLFREFVGKVMKRERAAVVSWLGRNPECFYPDLAKNLSFKQWDQLLRAYADRAPESAMRLVTASFNRFTEKDNPRFWVASLHVLGSIQGSMARRLLARVLLDGTGRLPKDRVDAILRVKDVASSLRRQARELIEAAEGEEQLQVAQILAKHLSSSDLANLVEKNLSARDDRSRASKLVQHIFATSEVDPTLVENVDRGAVLNFLLEIFSQAAYTDAATLQELPEKRSQAMLKARNRVAGQVLLGLKTASRGTISPELAAELKKLQHKIELWRDSPPPTISQLPPSDEVMPMAEAPDANKLRLFFRTPGLTANAIALFLGANPWAIPLLAADTSDAYPAINNIAAQTCRASLQLRKECLAALNAVNEVDEQVLVDLAVLLRADLADIEARLAPYFIFRDFLSEVGLSPVEHKMGSVLAESAISSDAHKLIPGNIDGRLRTVTLGIKVKDRVVGGVVVMKSGERDDRD